MIERRRPLVRPLALRCCDDRVVRYLPHLLRVVPRHGAEEVRQAELQFSRDHTLTIVASYPVWFAFGRKRTPVAMVAILADAQEIVRRIAAQRTRPEVSTDLRARQVG